MKTSSLTTLLPMVWFHDMRRFVRAKLPMQDERPREAQTVSTRPTRRTVFFIFVETYKFWLKGQTGTAVLPRL